jgi:hypothetical protein
MSKKLCTGCRHGATQDVGYSNYTVEGTVFRCIEECNPGMTNRGVSYESYESHDKPPFDWAEECEEFRVGKPQDYAVEDDFPEPSRNRRSYR